MPRLNSKADFPAIHRVPDLLICNFSCVFFGGASGRFFGTFKGVNRTLIGLIVVLKGVFKVLLVMFNVFLDSLTFFLASVQFFFRF